MHTVVAKLPLLILTINYININYSESEHDFGIKAKPLPGNQRQNFYSGWKVTYVHNCVDIPLANNNMFCRKKWHSCYISHRTFKPWPVAPLGISFTGCKCIPTEVYTQTADSNIINVMGTNPCRQSMYMHMYQHTCYWLWQCSKSACSGLIPW